ncbi:MAG: CNNM domain-containing protein [Planctomycetes bacterium]|jgi:CBS domain containing-hemolysin-like protein|nr:CNNM domain-containing protein [Planctomycetota bacterium]
MDHSVLPVLLALAMIMLAGLFEGAETGVYRLSRLRLRLGAEQGRWSALLLARAMRDSMGLLLALLIGTNLAHYLATSLITGLFLDVVSERAAEFYTTLVLAPLLFVFSQLIPKNVFLHRADLLTSFLAPLLYVSYRVFTWSQVVPLLKLVTNVFARLIGSGVPAKAMTAPGPRHHVRAILRDTQEEGLLSGVQAEMIDRIANIPGVRLSTVMVPLGQVRTVEIGADRAALLRELAGHTSTRLPVWRNDPSEIVGFVNVYDVLCSGEEFDGLEKFLLPIRSLDADTSMTDAINIMRRDHLGIVLVTRRRGRRDVPLGIATMKDLVEELLGELSEW